MLNFLQLFPQMASGRDIVCVFNTDIDDPGPHVAISFIMFVVDIAKMYVFKLLVAFYRYLCGLQALSDLAKLFADRWNARVVVGVVQAANFEPRFFVFIVVIYLLLQIVVAFLHLVCEFISAGSVELLAFFYFVHAINVVFLSYSLMFLQADGSFEQKFEKSSEIELNKGNFSLIWAKSFLISLRSITRLFEVIELLLLNRFGFFFGKQLLYGLCTYLQQFEDVEAIK